MKFMNCALQSLAVLASVRSSVYGFGTSSSSALMRQRSGLVRVATTTPIGVSSLSASYSTTRSLLKLSSTKKDQSFPTWSFDKPCTRMEWNDMVTASIRVSSDVASYQDSDLILVGIYAPPTPAATTTGEGEEESDEEAKEPPPVVLTGAAKEIDDSLGGILTEVIHDNAKTFKTGAKAGTMTPTVRVATPGGKSKRYVVIGMGKLPKDQEGADQSNAASADKIGFALGKAIAAKVNAEKKITSCAVILPKVLSDASTLTDISSSMYSSLYSDNRYRTADKIKKVAEDLTSVTLIATTQEEGGDKLVPLADVIADEALETGKKVAAGIFLTKDIVNSPHNVLNSISLADTAKRIAAESGGRLKCTILDKKECEKRGMGAYLGVARGSETEPQFIHLTYTPKVSKDNKKVGIVGKGLLFDTGGYNIKTSMMELMKFDCGGSAAVLGAARTIAAIAPEGVEAHFIVAACENMINERAMVPSDILTASNGKTIEIGNTDAEGRLTLADALVFADKEVGCESIIELSTLTGACMISLGKSIAGVWTSNDALAKELEEISKVTGDKSWRMPLESSYNEQLESKIADLSNVGTRYGGAITAALFLQNFVDKKKPFAHIDIAGPVWNDKTGATGYGTRMVTEWVKLQGEVKAE